MLLDLVVVVSVWGRKERGKEKMREAEETTTGADFSLQHKGKEAGKAERCLSLLHHACWIFRLLFTLLLFSFAGLPVLVAPLCFVDCTCFLLLCALCCLSPLLPPSVFLRLPACLAFAFLRVHAHLSFHAGRVLPLFLRVPFSSDP